ncbi:glycosyltransferase [Paenibacillus sp. FJAT-27812]|uniref:glycosyltransferase n=1 Tax=Paenibacillus sp. FJAT-27812 TaxID=1684143 RepID=UPI0006A762D9|nr:glycosyltransferase [Paenibacillus sp. FJAT-27812]
MKKKLLFVMNSLHCGGAEQSLISLLQTIDYSKHEVDLFLFKHEGVFLKKLPREVNVLDAPDFYPYFDMSIKTAVVDCVKQRRFRLAAARIGAGYVFRTEKNVAKSEQKVWRYLAKSLFDLDKEYDAAIGYLEKTPIYFVIDKVKARTKIGFIHTDYDKLGMDPAIDEHFFDKLNVIVTVSEECVRLLKIRFPRFEHKIELMHNIVSPAAIIDMSVDTIELPRAETIIASVGRLIHQKGFDLAVEACDRLVQAGYSIKWYIIGEGEERAKLEQLIKEKSLERTLILTGMQENPYPYIKQCDLYVQTSIYEGRCLTITEAKILKKPIVSTNFTVIYDQIKHEENGLIVNQDAASIYEGIKRLIDDESLRNHFVHNLQKEALGTEDEIHKLYQWIS